MTDLTTLPKNLNRLLLAGLIAASCATVLAQTSPVTPPPTGMRAPDAMRDTPPGAVGGHYGRGDMDADKMHAMMAKRQADMKAKLKITPTQESAWTAFTTALQPPAKGMGWRQSPEQRAEMAKLTTPERIDKMRAQRMQRMTEMTAMADKRDDAVKTFYAALTPEQKAVFDAEHAKQGHQGGMHAAQHPYKG